MSAVIVVVSGNVKKRNFWIEDEVLRVGSGPQCEVSLALPDLPLHMATVEFCDGQYVVHNRCDQNLVVGDHPLEPNQSSEWPPGAMLRCGPALTMVLQVDGDPSPSKKPFFAPEPVVDVEVQSPQEDAGETDQETTAAATLNSRRKICIILICGLLAVILAMGDESPTAVPSEKPPHEAFANAVENCQDPTLRTALQEAWMLNLRGDSEQADLLYRRIIELLEKRQEWRDLSESEAEIAQFSRAQLRT